MLCIVFWCSLCVCCLFVVGVVCYLRCLLLLVHRVLLFAAMLSFVIFGCLVAFAMCCWMFVARRPRSLFTFVGYGCCMFLVVFVYCVLLFVDCCCLVLLVG